jgi:hypothetical protein
MQGPLLVLLLLVLLMMISGAHALEHHDKIRLANYHRIHKQVLEAQQQIGEDADPRLVEARQRRLDTLQGFLQRQKESLESAGIDLSNMDWNEIEETERESDYHHHPHIPDGVPPFPHHYGGGFRDRDGEMLKRLMHGMDPQVVRKVAQEYLASRNVPLHEEDSAVGADDGHSEL